MGDLTVSLAGKLTGQDAAQIQRLDASNRRLEKVKDLRGCGRLVRLDLSHNLLESLGGIGGCRTLTWLDLSHNQLDSLAGLQHLTSLSVLRASNNNLTSCVDLSNLTSLKALILSHNQLSCLPGLSSLSELNTLVISHNKFESVSVDSLKKLSKLSMSNNALKAVPNTQNNIELRELRLNGNTIKSLPESLKSNGKLKIIDLGNNELKTISVLKPLSSLDQLVNLNLKGNQLCECPNYLQEVLGQVPSVKILDGSRVDGLALDGECEVSGSDEKSKTSESKATAENSVKRSVGKEKQKRKRGAAEEGFTAKSLVRKRKKSQGRAGDDGGECVKKQKCVGVPTESSEASEEKKEDVTDLVLTGPTANRVPGVLEAEYEIQRDQLSTTTHQALAGVKSSLKKTLSRGRSGVVAVKEVRQGRKRRKRIWEASATDSDNPIGNGQPSTWK